MTEDKYLTVSLTTKEIDRIFAKISIDPDTDCWNWIGSVSSWGYAQVSFRGNYHTSLHRLIYSWLVEPVPQGFGKDIPVLDHLCNNPRCCNPAHLKLVSHRENILRGDGAPAKNARKTHCKNGHPLPETFNTNRNERACMICRKEHTSTDEYRQYMRDRMRNKRKQSHLNPA